jgi:hypothetical protein
MPCTYLCGERGIRVCLVHVSSLLIPELSRLGIRIHVCTKTRRSWQRWTHKNKANSSSLSRVVPNRQCWDFNSFALHLLSAASRMTRTRMATRLAVLWSTCFGRGRIPNGFRRRPRASTSSNYRCTRAKKCSATNCDILLTLVPGLNFHDETHDNHALFTHLLPPPVSEMLSVSVLPRVSKDSFSQRLS